MRALCVGLISLAFFTAPAFAQDDEAPACMAPLDVTASLVQEAGAYDFSGFAGEGAVPAFIVGSLSSTRISEEGNDAFGSVIFVRNADASWRAFMPRPGEGVVDVYVAPTGAMIVATMWMTEGPGQSWTLLRSTDGLQSGVCGDVNFPTVLNKPTWANEFLHLHDLDIDVRGRGEIIGEGATENPSDLWFAYRTRDHGATWGPPRRLRGERAARAGLYQPVLDREAAAPVDLVADLTAYADGR